MPITFIVKEKESNYSSPALGKIQNPHDKFFKETFSNIEVTKSFLDHYLPPEVGEVFEGNTLYPEKDSFIDGNLKERFSDLLFSANIKEREYYIYFLFEHKSYPDKSVAFQLLKYMAEIWMSKKKKGQAEKLPIILPLVVYHGSPRWNIETGLGQMIVGYENIPPDILKYIPDYEYLSFKARKLPLQGM